MRELPDEAHELLAAARDAHDPSPAERQRADHAARGALAAAGVQLPPLMPSQPPASVATKGQPPVAAAGGGSSAAKLALVVAAVCVGGMFGLRAYRGTSEPSAAPVSTSVIASAPVRVVQPPMPIEATAAAPAERIAAETRHEPKGMIAAGRPAAHPRQSRATTPTTDLEAELQLIAAADTLVRGAEYGAALQRLDQHARRFPAGALRQERAALRVLSMCGRGSTEPALRARAHFLRVAPESVLTARVRSACGAQGADVP